jgi:cell division septum initiation protein DivIVA
MAQDQPSRSDASASEQVPGEAGRGRSFSELELRVHVPTEIRDPSFPAEMRGYSRRAVDAYIKRVNHLIAELEVSRSPRAAVQHALDRLTEEVGGILQRARETAEEITSSARKEADGIKARAGAEAAELVVNASDEADRARAEAERILAQARAEADKSLARSQAEAEEITSGARREAEGIQASASAEAAELVVNASEEADRARAEAERILAQARAEADKSLARSQAEAEEILARSRAEAEAGQQRSEKEFAVLQELAEARLRELRTDTEAVWAARSELLDDMGAVAARLEEGAREAAARFPSMEPAQRAEEVMAEPGSAAETESTGGVATDKPSEATPAVLPHESRDDEAPSEEPV